MQTRVNQDELTTSEKGQWEQLAAKWKQFGGEVKKKWGKLTDDEVMRVNGNRSILAGKIQEKYGLDKEAAIKPIDEWAKALKK